jgi:hypothetical protein
MSQAAQQLALGLVAVFLPVTMYLCSVGVLAAGFLRDDAEQRKIFPVRILNNYFRFAAKTAVPLQPGINTALLAVVVGGLILVSFAPAYVLAVNPYGGCETRTEVLVYLLVLGAWLYPVVIAIRRSPRGR